ncbi:hypothetical protein GCM10010441_61850 [Kitasatospora paracochleata]|uniref:transglycosylase family protein n=1 Tax=Kitasatospora paracochleata TaxID=58354 RepID=UPI0031E1D605
MSKKASKLARIALAAAIAVSGAIATTAATTGSAYAIGSSTAGGSIARSEILARAQSWVDQAVPYSQSAYWTDSNGTYRQDCSGLVSMAWHINTAGTNYGFATNSAGPFETQLGSLDDLKPGDAINNINTHMVLFAGWIDSSHTAALIYEEAHTGTNARTRTMYRSEMTSGGFLPFRYKNVVDDTPPVTDPVTSHVTGLAPAAVYNPDNGTAEVFAIGTDGVLSHAYSTNHGPWSDWSTIDPSFHFTGKPTAVYNPTNKTTEVFAIGTDGVLSHAYSTSGATWSDFITLDASYRFTGAPAVVYNPNNKTAEVFAVGADGVMSHAYNAGGGWTGWTTLDAGYKFAGAPSAVYNSTNKSVELFGTGTGWRRQPQVLPGRLLVELGVARQLEVRRHPGGPQRAEQQRRRGLRHRPGRRDLALLRHQQQLLRRLVHPRHLEVQHPLIARRPLRGRRAHPDPAAALASPPAAARGRSHDFPKDLQMTRNTLTRTRIGATAGALSLAAAAAFLGTGQASAASVATWDKVAQCESTGNWSINTNNGYYGGLQINLANWRYYGGTAYATRPDLATKQQQILTAEKILADQGAGAWTCSPNTGLATDHTNPYPDTTPTPTPTPTTAPSSAAPTAVYNPDTSTAEVFAVGADGVLSHSYSTDGGAWTDWATLDPSFRFTGVPAVVYNPVNKVTEVFATGKDGVISHNYLFNGGHWSGWSTIDPSYRFSGSPTAVYNQSDNAIELFGTGTDGVLNHTYNLDAGTWHGWTSLGTYKFAGNPTAVYESGIHSAEVFGIGTDGLISHADNANGSTWSNWTTLGTWKFQTA